MVEKAGEDPGFDAGPPQDRRDVRRRLIGGLVVGVHAQLAEGLAVVSHQNDGCSFQKSLFFERPVHLADEAVLMAEGFEIVPGEV